MNRHAITWIPVAASLLNACLLIWNHIPAAAARSLSGNPAPVALCAAPVHASVGKRKDFVRDLPRSSDQNAAAAGG